MDVSEIMTAEVVAVTPETAYKDVIEALLDHGVSGVPVVDDGMLVGIVTEADLLAGSAYDGDRSRALAVLADVLAAREHHWATKAGARTARDLMSRSVVSCTAETDVRTAARQMLDHGVTRLPVVRDGRLVGIVARHDLLRALARPDAQIAQEVERVLATDPNRPDDHHVVVAVDDGRVELSGDVRFPYDAAVVIAMVRGVEGVVSVRSNLHARERTPTTATAPWPWVTPFR
jgi:CBS domain-containing protein